MRKCRPLMAMWAIWSSALDPRITSSIIIRTSRRIPALSNSSCWLSSFSIMGKSHSEKKNRESQCSSSKPSSWGLHAADPTMHKTRSKSLDCLDSRSAIAVDLPCLRPPHNPRTYGFLLRILSGFHSGSAIVINGRVIISNRRRATNT